MDFYIDCVVCGERYDVEVAGSYMITWEMQVDGDDVALDACFHHNPEDARQAVEAA
jgi:hypothetical protein